MNTKKLQAKQVLLIAAALALLLMAILGLTVGQSYAKYGTQVVVTGSVTYNNRLAAKFEMYEDSVSQADNGAYSIDETPTPVNTIIPYLLIPGSTVPQDPYIRITNKTNIPAYLYVEIVGAPVGATMSSDWTLLEGVTGKNGGAVYVYDKGAAITGDGTGTVEYHLFSESFDTLPKVPYKTWSESAGEPSVESLEGTFTAYGYMIQATEGTKAEQVFKDKVTG